MARAYVVAGGNVARTALRQRMVEDMRMPKFTEDTQVNYIRAVVRWTRFLRASPDSPTGENLRRFQLDMVDHGAIPQTLNVTISGLKFFFGITFEKRSKRRCSAVSSCS